MSNKRSLNHHFQISTENREFNLEHNSKETENEDEQLQISSNFQNDSKKLKLNLDNSDQIEENGEQKFSMLMKKLKYNLEDKSKERETEGVDSESGENLFARLDENLVYEILKHADARTLGVVSCVSKIWNRTAQDERLWELICTRRWVDVNHGGGEKQLRSVVLALGGFRRLYSLYLSKTAASTSVAVGSGGRRGSKRWGKDEVNLSLSLLSIQFYEKMNNNNKGK